MSQKIAFITGVTGQDPSTSAFGDYTVAVNIADYRDDILAITGNLIPEPASGMLAGLGGLLFLRRRR